LFIVSEPSECRWDIINPNKPDKLESYNALANELTCETSVENSGCVNTVNNRLICGWVCSTTLPVTDVENDYFVQCRDQPWLGEDTERNVGSLFDYNLKRTETELVIDSIKPSGKIFSGSEPIIVNLEVETSGGAAGGNSLCEWSFDGELYVDRFKDSNGVKHRYTLNQMTAGDYELFVRCSDFVGNEVVDSTTFSLELDTTEPSVTRVFGNSGDVMVTTDEVARCFYNSSVSGCGFSSKNSKEFDGANSKLLSTDFLEGIDYNIFCEDVWGNRPDGCSIVVRRFDDV
jgi:hypothetical protein